MDLELIQYDPKLRGRLFLAVQKAIVATFDKSDWHELGHRTGQYDFISRHNRLLRSLEWNDNDYGGCVFEVLNHFLTYDPSALEAVLQNGKVRDQLEQHESQLLFDLGVSTLVVQSVPVLSASQVVRTALADADALFQTNGAVSAIDRLHTALHGYLRSICEEAQMPIPEGASITTIFKALRTQHPRLNGTSQHGDEVARIVMAFASVVDAVNTLRNHASVAHPNEDLLAPAEAELTVNAVRTLFNYIVSKIS
jgi:hypothetical protein